MVEKYLIFELKSSMQFRLKYFNIYWMGFLEFICWDSCCWLKVKKFQLPALTTEQQRQGN